MKKEDETKASASASATATPTTGTAPPAKASPLTAGSGDVDRLRTLAATLERNDLASAKAQLKTLVNELFDSWTPAAAPLVKGIDNAAHSEALKAHAQRIEEICQHAEGGTNHPVARAAAAGGAPWLQVVLPYLMQLLADLLARKTS
jgi:hypothetical protein